MHFSQPAVGILAQWFGGETGRHTDNKEVRQMEAVEVCNRGSSELPPINT